MTSTPVRPAPTWLVALLVFVPLAGFIGITQWRNAAAERRAEVECSHTGIATGKAITAARWVEHNARFAPRGSPNTSATYLGDCRHAIVWHGTVPIPSGWRRLVRFRAIMVFDRQTRTWHKESLEWF